MIGVTTIRPATFSVVGHQKRTAAMCPGWLPRKQDGRGAHGYRDQPWAVHWLDQPGDHDYGAAADYLSMVAEPAAVEKTVAALRTAQPVYRKAKDSLRAAQLALLPETNAHVTADLGKISSGKRLSPILLVRGDVLKAVKLEIVGGYHRVCASYVTDENTPICCRLVSWQT